MIEGHVNMLGPGSQLADRHECVWTCFDLIRIELTSMMTWSSHYIFKNPKHYFSLKLHVDNTFDILIHLWWHDLCRWSSWLRRRAVGALARKYEDFHFSFHFTFLAISLCIFVFLFFFYYIMLIFILSDLYTCFLTSARLYLFGHNRFIFIYQY